MSSKSGSDYSGFALLVCLLVGVMAAHVHYVTTAHAEIRKLKTENPGREIRVHINYGNLAHLETLCYGLGGGLVVGTVAAASVRFIRHK